MFKHGEHLAERNSVCTMRLERATRCGLLSVRQHTKDSSMDRVSFINSLRSSSPRTISGANPHSLSPDWLAKESVRDRSNKYGSSIFSTPSVDCIAKLERSTGQAKHIVLV